MAEVQEQFDWYDKMSMIGCVYLGDQPKLPPPPLNNPHRESIIRKRFEIRRDLIDEFDFYFNRPISNDIDIAHVRIIDCGTFGIERGVYWAYDAERDYQHDFEPLICKKIDLFVAVVEYQNRVFVRRFFCDVGMLPDDKSIAKKLVMSLTKHERYLMRKLND